MAVRFPYIGPVQGQQCIRLGESRHLQPKQASDGRPLHQIPQLEVEFHIRQGTHSRHYLQAG